MLPVQMGLPYCALKEETTLIQLRQLFCDLQAVRLVRRHALHVFENLRLPLRFLAREVPLHWLVGGWLLKVILLYGAVQVRC